MTRLLPFLAFWACIGLVSKTGPGFADTAVAARTIRSHAILSAADIELRRGDETGPFRDAASLVGLETREILYAGRPIRTDQVGPPSLVNRNEVVVMIYTLGPVQIATEGRALGRAAKGEPVRVMNLSSRNTITARVEGPALVSVQGPRGAQLEARP